MPKKKKKRRSPAGNPPAVAADAVPHTHDRAQAKPADLPWPWPPQPARDPPFRGLTPTDDGWDIDDSPGLVVRLTTKGYAVFASEHIDAGTTLLPTDVSEYFVKIDPPPTTFEDPPAQSTRLLQLIYGSFRARPPYKVVAGLDDYAPKDFTNMPPLLIVNEGLPNVMLVCD